MNSHLIKVTYEVHSRIEEGGNECDFFENYNETILIKGKIFDKKKIRKAVLSYIKSKIKDKDASIHDLKIEKVKVLLIK